MRGKLTKMFSSLVAFLVPSISKHICFQGSNDSHLCTHKTFLQLSERRSCRFFEETICVWDCRFAFDFAFPSDLTVTSKLTWILQYVTVFQNKNCSQGFFTSLFSFELFLATALPFRSELFSFLSQTIQGILLT